MRSAAVCLGLVAALGLWPGPAQAHKLHVFATVDGKLIRGQVYFRGGGAAVRVPVQALGPADEPLGQTTTDAQGNFVLPARFRCEHRLVVDAGGGHVGEYRISAHELPGDLPRPALAGSPEGISDSPHPPASLAPRPNPKSNSGEGIKASTQPPASLAANRTAPPEFVAKEPPPGDASASPSVHNANADLAASIEAVRSQVLRLREEFDAFRQETRLRDVLGGIGYILGLMGVVLYIVSRRSSQA